MTATDHSRINKAAEPRFLKGDGHKAVLIIHGFTGYPGEYYELAEELHDEGYTVSVPLLPGHGRRREDFIKTNWPDWLEFIRKAYMELNETHDSVSIVGLSMGGVLTLLLAAEFNPEKIALLAPAMAIDSPVYYLTPFLQYFIKETPKNWTPEKNDSDDVIQLGREYWSRNYIKQIAGLNKLSRMARTRLGKISCPTLMMLSEIDKTVPLKAGTIIEKGLKNCRSEKIILKNSHHVILTGAEKEYVKKEVLSWIIRGENNEQ